MNGRTEIIGELVDLKTAIDGLIVAANRLDWHTYPAAIVARQDGLDEIASSLAAKTARVLNTIGNAGADGQWIEAAKDMRERLWDAFDDGFKAAWKKQEGKAEYAATPHGRAENAADDAHDARKDAA